MKRITQSEDGIPRITMKIEVRLSAHDMAVHLIDRLQYEIDMYIRTDETVKERNERIENSLKNAMSGLSDKRILDLIQTSIELDGLEHPHYNSSQGTGCGIEVAVDFLTGYLQRKYKGFQS